MPYDALLVAVVSLPFVGSVIAALLPANARNVEAWLAGGVASACLVLSAWLYPVIASGETIIAKTNWLPEFGLSFTLRIDGFAWLFTQIVTGIGLLVVLYSHYYMSPKDPVPRFFALLLAFMGSMLGIVLSGNLIQLVFFWELTSLLSFLLIGYWHHNAAARDGARMALTVTSIGGLSLLVGVLLIGHIVGSYDLDEVLEAAPLIKSHSLYVPVVVLITLGAFTKSAQFPFHFWLPSAMAAPTPVSAYLHSATLVKAGVFLLARLWPALAGTDAWFLIVVSVGLTTLLIGAYLAIFQHDLKGLLAYSTISHLGLITLLLGLGSPLAAVAAIFHMMNHATFKASLFMAAGIIDHESGTRDIRRLSGLYRFMPVTATLAMVAAAAMAGVPLLNGFLSKEMFFAETVEDHVGTILDHMLPYGATLAGAFSVAYSLRFIHGSFFGPPPTDLPRTPHEPPHWMRFPIELLVLLCLIVGIIPGITVGAFLDTAVRSVLGTATPVYSLAVWHGFTLPLVMSVIALAGGVALYLALQGYLKKGIEGPPFSELIRNQRIFDRVMVVLSWRFASTLAQFIGTRRLQPQLRLLVGTALIAATVPLALRGLGAWRPAPSAIDPVLALVWLVGIVCALGAAWQAKYHRLAALILMGGAGLVTCVTFIWLSAPDLALTQLLVEVVTTVLLLLGLRWLPKRVQGADPDLTEQALAPLRRLRDLVVAIIAGGGVALLVYSVMTRPSVGNIGQYFIDNAYTKGGGRNVVNVILVDFRGFDTLGEITVLGVVALTVYALLRRFRPAADSVDMPEQQRTQNRYDEAHPERRRGAMLADSMMVPSVVMRLMFPTVTVLALFLLLRGHDQPGGGFVAGITMAVAFILQYMAFGTRWVEDRLRILPVRWIGAGLMLAALTGLAAWPFARPFLTSYFGYAELPLIGKTPVASALAFDIGVFALVVGATVLVLIALAHQSVRTHRAVRSAAEAAEVAVVPAEAR